MVKAVLRIPYPSSFEVINMMKHNGVEMVARVWSSPLVPVRRARVVLVGRSSGIVAISSRCTMIFLQGRLG